MANHRVFREEGLARRFPNRLHLDDYTPGELGEICEMCARPFVAFKVLLCLP